MSKTISPVVSVYIPSFNRAHLIHNSINSVLAQSFKDWELIIVDDGSTDDTREVVRNLTANIKQPVKYIYQENHGLFYSRNVGVDHASGKYIAPLDSDDAWEPHHLADCVAALEKHAHVDWVYGSLARTDADTGQILDANKFYANGQPKPFLSLATESDGELKIINDDRIIECAILNGLHCGQQTSVIRRWVLEKVRFYGRYRICEDQQYPIRALLAGARFAYFDDIHLNYSVHANNISNVNTSQNSPLSDSEFAKLYATQNEIIQLFEELLQESEGIADSQIRTRVRTAVGKRLSKEYFWRMGYSTMWRSGRYPEAMDMFKRAARYNAWDFNCWKTFMMCRFRMLSASIL